MILMIEACGFLFLKLFDDQMSYEKHEGSINDHCSIKHMYAELHHYSYQWRQYSLTKGATRRNTAQLIIL